ncbi:MAG TPA: aminotransferase class I/II-fold pyridoxal phosphate-dependent enzyme [Pseudorhodoplanes sp.]|nr:aminotransferase class I/II-fold pyridoxal phosphate-dependent enzyme [Pseudorhodoplanes sp.]HWV53061.1 aminotransferase class I/II-fold pyridoxal phosphate-dependent enzyme [Pseudorhodoplanes sp.]
MNAAEREQPPSSARTAEPRAQGRSAFARLNDLLAPIEPGRPAINCAVGEPQHPVPAFAGPVFAKHIADLGRYPANKGTELFRKSVTGWLSRRYDLARPLDPETEVLVLNGTREGLFLAALAATRNAPPRTGKPAILVPNPCYGAYSAGASASQCETVYMPATAGSGFLPDLDAIDDALLARTVVIYLASPANPQGSVAGRAYLERLVAMARKHDVMIFSDECYSEIYFGEKPVGILEVAGPDYAKTVTFNSLSKRSNLPGLRVGFVAGDRDFLARFLEYRNNAAPQVPMPAQAVAAAALDDETHVIENRKAYAQKFDLADQILGDRYGYKRPPGGFFLWLDVSAQGGSVRATERLWREAGLRVLPGEYASHTGSDGSNPGRDYIRVAMVHDNATTAEALHRLVAVLG